MSFETSFSNILDKIDAIDPKAYAQSRNFVDGAVSYLSPYISRGVISTRFVLESLLKKGYGMPEMEKFVQELAWRDYWQQIWIAKGEDINNDLKREQPDFSHTQIPAAILAGKTGIEVVDEHIAKLWKTGYIHNHMRMYIASIACNIGRSHWKVPAQWMYYHLLDGDWASNALSWQWVAGANANKKYYANQENINTFFYLNQKGSFLDVPYEAFPELETPEILKETQPLRLSTNLPPVSDLKVDASRPTLVYNYYNLDPNWHADLPANRVLLLEPSIFERYPVADHCLEFCQKLGENIPDLQVFVGEFHDLKLKIGQSQVHFKEHPLNGHYEGEEEPRDWMFGVKGYYPSFFAFWKKCKKEIKTW
ncbi:FAD-binding domain-containing protein [Roseivirga misakiensis]|uniref:Deoxyribodipyrimidine photolyase n=1 Tax=Roseivirga misakiensis TaxID=1563681 RepID=A0A1E5SKT4_9BACT|nr:FAD-binding domain-containing protein [Roseivirga misakiensis]OEJ99738.1 deoxyribodipyrimidine photolyase [Roseivirga misakiensis]